MFAQRPRPAFRRLQRLRGQLGSPDEVADAALGVSDAALGVAHPDPGRLLGLQRAAGNRAVGALLRPRRVVQRFPTASPDAVGPDAPDALEKNLEVAERELARPDFLKGQLEQARAGAGTARSNDPALTTDVLLGQIWRLPTSASKVPVKQQPRYTKLRNTAVAALQRLYAPISSEKAIADLLKDPATVAALQKVVGGRQAAAASFDVFELADDLWEHWLRLSPLTGIGLNQWGASDGRKPLRAAIDGMVESWADTFSGPTHGKHKRPDTVTVVADPAADEIAAVSEAIKGRETWVREGDMAAVASSVASKLGRPAPEVQAALPRWLIHAERAILKETLPQQTANLSPSVWAYARSVFVSSMDKPVWRFYTDDIVGFELFGQKIMDKPGGVHRAILPTLRLVEQEALRIAGKKTLAELSFDKGEASGFRFDPAGADLRKHHVSWHGTGLAIDFRVKTNNVIWEEATTDLLDQIAAQGNARDAVKPAAPDSKQQTDWANEVQGHLRNRDALRERVKALEAAAPAAPAAPAGPAPEGGTTEGGTTEGEPSPAPPAPNPDLAKAQAELATEEQWLGDVGTTAKAVDLRDRGEALRTHLESVEAGFQKSFLQHFGARPPIPEKATAKERAEWDAARTEALKTGWPAMRQDILDRLPDAAKKPFEAKFPKGSVPIAMLKTLDPFLDFGLTDQPPWMVKAFSSLGWRWGGGWHAPMDAMHFDFMGDVPGVRN